jgi:O-antigen/teichoic acid export membrane protein
MQAGKKVIMNTFFLYGKMIISIGIALYSTRLVLSALGATDYGIFNLVGGVIAMLAFLNGAMGTSTQRYISIFLGKGDFQQLSRVFRASIRMHLVIGLIIVLILEIAGLFLFNGFLNIPTERIFAAKIVFHFMVFSTFFSINAVPYDALINAHENLLFDALTGIGESFVKLGIAIWLIYSDFDRLIFYSLLIALLTVSMRIIKSIYCYRKYDECKTNNGDLIGKSLYKEMYSFAGWNLFGSLAKLGRAQGISIILNLFFGTVINAAYGIANHVAGQISNFSVMMLKAINPQIMKSEGANDRQRMIKWSMAASKFSFLLLAFFAIPFIFEMKAILNLWLNEVPEYTIAFCNLVLIAMLANQLTIGLQSAAQSTGRIKLYQITVGSLFILNLPIAYFLLSFGLEPYSVLISYIIIELFACTARIIFVKYLAGMSISEYLNEVVLRDILTIIPMVLSSYMIVQHFDFEFRFMLTIAISSILFAVSVFYIGLSKNEREFAVMGYKRKFLKIT